MNHRAFEQVLIIMFENEYRGYVMKNEYMRNLAAQGIELTNSFGVMHPSQTNYITSISGELCNVSNDSVPNPYLRQKTIVDLIEAAGQLDWRAYMESYIADWVPWKAEGFDPSVAADPKVAEPCVPVDPSKPSPPCLAEYFNYPYVLKHNPFSSYKNILESEARWQKIVNEAAFYRDLLNGDFPQYAWFTPNMWNDGHYLQATLNNTMDGERAPTLVNQQAVWLESFFRGIGFPGPNSKLPPNTLVVVTYDEADFESAYDKKASYKYFYDGPNQIYTVLLGDMIQPGKQHEGYNHYSLLRTIEKNFNLGDLGKNDRHANWFQFLWGKQFRWQHPRPTPIEEAANMQAASYGDQLFIAYTTPCGDLYYRTFGGENFSPPIHAAASCGQQLALAGSDSGLVLAWRNDKGHLLYKTYNLSGGWSAAGKLVEGRFEDAETVGEDGRVTGAYFSIAALPGLDAFVLVYQEQNGTLQSLRYENGGWQQTPNQPCCNSDGPFQLGALGTTLLLVYKAGVRGNMACLSYNTAEFNKVQVPLGQFGGPYDDTTMNMWSPCSFSISHFSSGPSVLTPGEDEPIIEGYEAEGLLACATLDGVLHLLHNNPGNSQLVSETFSIGGTLTPKKPVSYDPAKQTTTSNGYGTLYEAGWSTQSAINSAIRDAGSPLTAARFNGHLWIFFRDAGEGSIRLCCGGYQ